MRQQAPHAIPGIREPSQIKPVGVGVEPNDAATGTGDGKIVVPILVEVAGHTGHVTGGHRINIEDELVTHRTGVGEHAVDLHRIPARCQPRPAVKVIDLPVIEATTADNQGAGIGQHRRAQARAGCQHTAALDDRLPGAAIDNQVARASQDAAVGHHHVVLEDVRATQELEGRCICAVANHEVCPIAVNRAGGSQGASVEQNLITSTRRDQRRRPDLTAIHHQRIAARRTHANRHAQIGHDATGAHRQNVASGLTGHGATDHRRSAAQIPNTGGAATSDADQIVVSVIGTRGITNCGRTGGEHLRTVGHD